MLKVGLVGLGTISVIHEMAIQASGLGELVAVCDIDPKTHKNFSQYRTYTDLEEMLQAEELDVVHILLPHDLHASATLQCMAHGVHVMLEKPIAISYQEGRHLEEAVSQSDVKVGVTFQNRYNKTTRTLQRILKEEAGTLGPIQAIKGIVSWFRPVSYYEEQPWRGNLQRAGGGTIINQSIHTLDLMHYLGGDIEAAKAQLFNLLDYDIEVEDTAAARFQMEQGRVGLYVATNAYTRNSSVEIEVVTQRQRFVIVDHRLYRYRDEQTLPELICEDDLLEGFKTYYGYGHQLCVASFYEAIIHDHHDYISVTAALPSMLMVDLMKASSRLQRLVTAKEIINNDKS